VAIVVYYRLSYMQSRLTHKILQFLPTAMGWNLFCSSDQSWLKIPRVGMLTPWRNTTNSSSDLRDRGLRPFSRPRNGICADKYLNLVPTMCSDSRCPPGRRKWDVSRSPDSARTQYSKRSPGLQNSRSSTHPTRAVAGSVFNRNNYFVCEI
jgi:hypothetical protein